MRGQSPRVTSPVPVIECWLHSSSHGAFVRHDIDQRQTCHRFTFFRSGLTKYASFLIRFERLNEYPLIMSSSPRERFKVLTGAALLDLRLTHPSYSRHPYSCLPWSWGLPTSNQISRPPFPDPSIAVELQFVITLSGRFGALFHYNCNCCN
jgi:hypothetical protein